MTDPITYNALRRMFLDHGCSRIMVKVLAPNDNSKNQPYIAKERSLVGFNILPASEFWADGRNFKAQLDFRWLDGEGRAHPAPHAKLIQYKKYNPPEVRLSGFLKDCAEAPSELMTTRLPGRVLILGIAGPTVYAHVVGPESPIAATVKALIDSGMSIQIAALHEVNLEHPLVTTEDSIEELLGEVHSRGWISGSRLNSDGSVKPNRAQNAGGTTLEAALGIGTNSEPKPDLLGWEIKSCMVKDLGSIAGGHVVTAITAAPRGGYYKDPGVEAFLRRFGYPDRKGRADRINFGGVHRIGVRSDLTGAKLCVEGFDSETGVEATGRLVLVMQDGTEGAIWPFPELLEHWTRKHEKTVFVPCERRADDNTYRYSNRVYMGWGSDLNMFVSSLVAGHSYYDPGVKLEGASTDAPKTKPRHQFRVKFCDVPSLFRAFEARELPLPVVE